MLRVKDTFVRRLRCGGGAGFSPAESSRKVKELILLTVLKGRGWSERRSRPARSSRSSRQYSRAERQSSSADRPAATPKLTFPATLFTRGQAGLGCTAKSYSSYWTF